MKWVHPSTQCLLLLLRWEMGESSAGWGGGEGFLKNEGVCSFISSLRNRSGRSTNSLNTIRLSLVDCGQKFIDSGPWVCCSDYLLLLCCDER